MISKEIAPENIRRYKDRVRILVILYVFGDPYSSQAYPKRKRRFETEMRLQKIDFLLRYPDYFAYELLRLAESGEASTEDIEIIVQGIFEEREPEIRRDEMERFFFGSYEDIDDVIAFLKSIEFVEFSSEKSLDLKTIKKVYYVREEALCRFETYSGNFPLIGWYLNRSELIKRFFGMKTASDLRKMQYLLDEVKNADFHEVIAGITGKAKQKFEELFGRSVV